MTPCDLVINECIISNASPISVFINYIYPKGLTTISSTKKVIKVVKIH